MSNGSNPSCTLRRININIPYSPWADALHSRPLGPLNRYLILYNFHLCYFFNVFLISNMKKKIEIQIQSLSLSVNICGGGDKWRFVSEIYVTIRNNSILEACSFVFDPSPPPRRATLSQLLEIQMRTVQRLRKSRDSKWGTALKAGRLLGEYLCSALQLVGSRQITQDNPPLLR